MDFESYPKIPRLSRDIIITEKLDGTNAQVLISDDGSTMTVGSRNRFITPESDNFGFAKWAKEHEVELLKLGPGRHFGEWWGAGIGRRYGLTEKRFSLFNTLKWEADRPSCCGVVPVLYKGPFSTAVIDEVLGALEVIGSRAAPGFMDPEGIVIFHIQGGVLFKKTIKDDEVPKGSKEA